MSKRAKYDRGSNSYRWNNAMVLCYRSSTFCIAIGLVMLVCVQSCRRSESEMGNETDRPPEPPTTKSVLVFPEAVKVADDSVNRALDHAMTVSMSGDYDAFRLLWSAREDPLPRDEFEKGFGAVEEIRIEALEKVILAGGAHNTGAQNSDGEAVYAAYATIRLDPAKNLGQPEPERRVVLMLVHEHGDWRLARAPKELRAWLKEKVKVALSEPAKVAHQPEPSKSP
ncbi:MAG: hypothetical protein IID43_05670 [Planctomycetes bacterium]|nr:hypothetical protein [Planctomycetota bacterium]